MAPQDGRYWFRLREQSCEVLATGVLSLRLIEINWGNRQDDKQLMRKRSKYRTERNYRD